MENLFAGLFGLSAGLIIATISWVDAAGDVRKERDHYKAIAIEKQWIKYNSKTRSYVEVNND